MAIDDGPTRVRIRHALHGRSAVVRAIGTRSKLWSRLTRESSDLVAIGLNLVPKPWREALRRLRESHDAPDVLIFTPDDSPEQRAHLLAAGATAVLSPDLSHEVLSEVLDTLRINRRQRTVDDLRHRTTLDEPRLSDFVSASTAMQEFMDLVERTLESDATLLLTGETGVGKERLARAIHAESRRAEGPFVAVNCAALPDQLLESELFGHMAGAFTGAGQARRGWFELAHGGTLFLDEIGDLPTHLQAKLLRAVQDHEFQPLGSERSIRVDVRIMAATAEDLSAAVESGQFRRDLFYRLSVITLRVPALRERPEDLPALVTDLLEFFRVRLGRPAATVSTDALAALTGYSWPGNVRELRNVIERALLLCDGNEIEVENLPDSIAAYAPHDARAAAVGEADAAQEDSVESRFLSQPWKDVREQALDDVERRYLEALLTATAGRIGETARRAGIAPRSVHEKMRRHGLRKEDFRGTPRR